MRYHITERCGLPSFQPCPQELCPLRSVFSSMAGSSGQLRSSSSISSHSPYTRSCAISSPLGRAHAFVGFRSQRRARWRFHWSLSSKESRLCKIAWLFKKRMSPCCMGMTIWFFSAVKCTASRASAWASVIGGIPGVRGCFSLPVNNRLEKLRNTLPSWRNSNGR